MSNLDVSKLGSVYVDEHVRYGSCGFPLLPGGVGRSAYYVGAPTPYAMRGEGYRVWDDRGQELIDANNNFTVLVHGNANPQINEAAVKAMHEGLCWGIPNVYEWEHADLMLQRLPGLDQIRYTNSGTEAVMTAVRIARACTGRDGVIMTKNGYHGSSDVALCAGPEKEKRGVPASVREDVKTIALNDLAALQEEIAANPNRYAAIVLDLLPNKAGLHSVSQGFVQAARDLATLHGIVLIFDEVISFRLGYNGLSGEYGVKPDLLTTGKLIGGGFPIGAVAGREELMREVDPARPNAIPLSGTFSGNPMCMAAGIQTLKLLTEETIANLNALGDSARAALSKRLAPMGWEARGRGSLLRAFPKGAPLTSELQQKVWWAAYDRGLLISPSNLGALSSPMNARVVEDLVDRLADAVACVCSQQDL
jgi:glutamate-1-semialdehyde 2,1-aminomutase